MDERRNVTDEILKSTLTLDVDQQLDLALQSVAPTIRAIHLLAKSQRILDAETLDQLSKAVGILIKIRQEQRREVGTDPSQLSDAELKKQAKK